eukprot:comp12787_c0_seq1/m.7925 comp12787_c0_seq1/g.7925  ORF comp12787_c0_seq1/g.7925 comp12787_c0_seq1/m.7925 type:complete len:745 (-) comp12787_c0_seq1:613-2847(-)
MSQTSPVIQIQACGQDTSIGAAASGGTKDIPAPLPVNMEPLSQAKDKVSWLLRFFRSEFFDAFMAIAYLFKYPDSGVRDYLCNELFNMAAKDVEFFLPQLAKLCIMKAQPGDGVERFLLHHSCRHLNWAVALVWILDSAIKDRQASAQPVDYCIALRNNILNQRAKFADSPNIPKPPPSPSVLLKNGKLRLRSIEEASRSPPPVPLFATSFSTLKPTTSKPVEATRSQSQNDILSTKTVSSVDGIHSVGALGHKRCASTGPGPLADPSSSPALKSFLDQVETAHHMQHGIPSNLPMMYYLEPQMLFINALVGIDDRLVTLTTKEMRKAQLFAELTIVNLNLPARVYLPLLLAPGSPEHHVVRIPPEESVILNSKDRVPFMVCVEVVECPSVQSTALPVKRSSRRDTGLVGSVIFSDNSMPPSDGEEETESKEKGKGRFLVAEDKARARSRSFQDDSVLQLKEPWEIKQERIRQNSPYGTNPNWRLYSIIVKCGDDLRQEVLASQLIQQFKNIWEAEHLDLWLRPTRVMVTSSSSGLMETIVDTLSVHSIKKQFDCSLADYFKKEFGDPKSLRHRTAQRNFVRSFAAYSLVCYFLAVKDRHNGNILMTKDGFIVHIDFGFFLSNSPRNLGFETSFFKLNTEFVAVMGGVDGEMYAYFRELMWKGFVAARKHQDKIVTLVDMMQQDSQLPCFHMGADCVRALRERFHLSKTEEQLREWVTYMIGSSLDHMSTRLYDNFQYYTNGIL